MIKDSTFFYAPSGTGKTTYLQEVWARDRHLDLAINLNRSHLPFKNHQVRYRTRAYLVTPDRKTPALSLSGSPVEWTREIFRFKIRKPRIQHLLIDESQAVPAVYITQLIQLVRGIYRHRVPVIMCGLKYGRFNGHYELMPQVRGLINVTERVIRFKRADKPNYLARF